MTVFAEVTERTCNPNSQMSMRILDQMAEALEDQVAALYRRAAGFEEEEFLLNREVEERQTEINRLMLKLETMRADRDRVMEKIELISSEAAAIREQVFSSEDDVALAAIDSSTVVEPAGLRSGDVQSTSSGGDPTGSPTFFLRLALDEDGRQAQKARIVPDYYGAQLKTPR
jgi:predicted RNase H-like nuclease (RuvC/YqgF family)